MKYLIINADDLGHTAGINRGIREAHEHGIVGSASLMVDEPASEEACRLLAELPELSVGLHVQITDENARPAIDLRASATLRAELQRQVERFQGLAGRQPAHLDSHHNVHFRPEAAPVFAEVAAANDLMLRGTGSIRYVSSFYGQWDGETHLEQIEVESLLSIIASEAGMGFTELGCHPGYVDGTLTSSYAVERETELRTLCEPRVRTRLGELGFELIDSISARRLLAAAEARK